MVWCSFIGDLGEPASWPLAIRSMPSQPESTPSGPPARYETIRRVEPGICVADSPASRTRSRRRSGPTAFRAASVAVLSLCDHGLEHAPGFRGASEFHEDWAAG